MITIVVPTHNEAAIIQTNLERLLTFLRTHVTEECLRPEASAKRWRVIVADNESTDPTRAIVRRIAATEPRCELLEIPEAGKGRAVLEAWTHVAKLSTINSQLSTFVFIDADLATDLHHLPELISAIHNGADVAMGSRYAQGARVQRSVLRGIVSRAYRIVLHNRFGLRVTDAPCGFKAVSARVVRDIVPHIRDTGWFFDTELCIRAERAGMRIVELPVSWHEPRRGGSLAKVLRIIAHDLHAMRHLRRELRTMRQV